MARFPSSYIVKKEATQGEFVLASNREPYVGPYLATKDGRYFAGSDKNLLGPSIIKQSTQFPKEFGKNKNTRIFNLLKKGVFRAHAKHKTLVSSKSIPTEADYKKGYYYRYFLYKQNNPDSVIEIKTEDYLEVNKRKELDRSLYSVDFIKWCLKGDVASINKKTIDNKVKSNPFVRGIKNIFFTLNEFYKPPKFGESTSVENNIPNRYYPDNNGEPGEIIPSNLPESYQIPPYPNQKCQNCIFLKRKKANGYGHCSKWRASIKQSYWCKSWVVNVENYIDLSYAQFLEEQGTSLGTPSFGGFLGNLSPFGVAGQNIGETRYYPPQTSNMSGQTSGQNGRSQRYEWNGEIWEIMNTTTAQELEQLPDRDIRG